MGDFFVVIEYFFILLMVVFFDVQNGLVGFGFKFDFFVVVFNEGCGDCCVIFEEFEGGELVFVKYFVDFIECVCVGKFDFVIGCDQEICCVVQVLV